MGGEREVCVPAVSRPWYMPWADLVSFRPPQSVQEYVHKRSLGGVHFDWKVQAIEKAQGPVNIDYYPVTVSKLPNYPRSEGTDVDDKPIPMRSPSELLRYIRIHIAEFVPATDASDPSNSPAFIPYTTRYPKEDNPTGSNDAAKWKSFDPVNTVISIVLDVHADDGSVVCSESDEKHWRFSTLYTTSDQAHAVSGNREWGYMPGEEGSSIFYTRGVDRMTRVVDDIIGGMASVGWNAADLLWKSLQAKIVSFVKINGGTAEIGDKRCVSIGQANYVDNRVSTRVDWKKGGWGITPSQAQIDLFHPTETWSFGNPFQKVI